MAGLVEERGAHRLDHEAKLEAGLEHNEVDGGFLITVCDFTRSDQESQRMTVRRNLRLGGSRRCGGR